MKKIFWLIFLSSLALTSCGRKGALSHPKDEKRPKFAKVVDEEPNMKFPENMIFIEQPQTLSGQPIIPNALQQNAVPAAIR